MLLATTTTTPTYVHHYVRLSQGSLRYINIRQRNQLKRIAHAGHCAAALVVVTGRTLTDPLLEVLTTLDYEFKFTEIWATNSYEEELLPKKNPAFALINPENPDVLYFFISTTVSSASTGTPRRWRGASATDSAATPLLPPSVRGWCRPK